MEIKSDLQYAKSHEWVEKVGEGVVRVGLSDYAQKQLGDLVFVNLPGVGDTVAVEEPFGDVESVKAVFDVISPVTGTVTAINELLLDAPQTINEDPYGAWFIEISDVTDSGDLMDAEAYEDHVKAQG